MKITLACAGGMSTGMLVQKMLTAATAKGLQVEINACAASELDQFGTDADVILLGPQVAYQQTSVKSRFPSVPVVVINMTDYGMMNGEKVLADALRSLAA